MSQQSRIPGTEIRRKEISAFSAIFVLVVAVALTPVANSQTFQVIHQFSGTDGEHPYAGLTMDGAGRLYGTTAQGGASGYGTVFRLARAGSSWVLTTLYTFQGGSDGAYPSSRVVFGPDGTLYGNTSQGGVPDCGGQTCGTVFNLQPPSTVCRSTLCPWTKTTLHSFQGTGNGFDGQSPVGDLTFDSAGNIYGATNLGGQYNTGMVYELTRTSGGWTETNLHSFTNTLGFPDAGVTLDSSGNLYGTTQFAYDYYGSVYELSPSGSGWVEQTIHKFQLDDGGFPYASVILDNVGNLYGATTAYGVNNGGTAFELSPANGSWSFSLLYSFAAPCCGEGGPRANLTFDQAGNLYGTTSSDGADQLGSIFKLTHGSNGWTYTSLYDFNDASIAADPMSNVIFDTSGNLYGTYAIGYRPAYCSYGCGGVWEITP